MSTVLIATISPIQARTGAGHRILVLEDLDRQIHVVRLAAVLKELPAQGRQAVALGVLPQVGEDRIRDGSISWLSFQGDEGRDGAPAAPQEIPGEQRGEGIRKSCERVARPHHLVAAHEFDQEAEGGVGEQVNLEQLPGGPAGGAAAAARRA